MPKDKENKKERPSMGSGMAEKAAKDIEERKKKRKEVMKDLFGGRRPNNADN